jgi:hypothetical protein
VSDDAAGVIRRALEGGWSRVHQWRCAGGEVENEVMNTEPDLLVEVLDDKIVVSLPESYYSVTYYKPATSPQLFARRISDKNDPRVAMTLSEFLAKAWNLANDKARELGWIV